MSAPVGSIHFVCNHCVRCVDHAYPLLTQGRHGHGMYAVDAGSFFRHHEQCLAFSDTIEEAQSTVLRLGAPICFHHWLHEVKLAVDINMRANDHGKHWEGKHTIEGRMAEKGYTFWHHWWMKNAASEGDFTADLPHVLNDIRSVDADAEAVLHAVSMDSPAIKGASE